MLPVDQTRFGDDGNCFAACVASVLEVPLADVPDPGEAHRNGKSWRHVLAQWLNARGLAYIEVKRGRPGWEMVFPKTHHIMGGMSPRCCQHGHAVVGFKGEIVFDPHPSRDGLTEIEDYGFFVKLFA